jgi:dTDP-4-amino-4,6-dideoxygalactose transaminase
MKVKFVDLQRQNKIIFPEIDPLLKNLIFQADFNMGSKLDKFEKDFASFLGKKYVIGLNSGTDAIFLSLIAYGIQPGDEVIVPVNSYFSTAMVVSNLGSVPIFVDINPLYFTIDILKLEKAITKKTKAIIPVHLYGQSADMLPIIKLAKKFKLNVIEDCCQAHGCIYRNKIVPFGETGAFSFYPGKNLGAFGDGGCIATDNKNIYEKVLFLRNDGSRIKYTHSMFGIKSRLDTLQAVVLNSKLKYLNRWNKLRQEHALLYTDLLKEVQQVKTPLVLSNSKSVFHLYVIEVEKRNSLQIYLRKKGIETGIHYPTPIHLQKPYKDLGYKTGDFPITEEKSKKILSLPMFPELTNNEIMYVVKSIKDFYSK